MKHFSKLLLLSFLLFSLVLPAFSQEMTYAPGELIVMVEKGTDLNRLVERLQSFQGAPTQLKPLKSLSPPLNIWLWHFDESAVSEVGFLDYVLRQPEVKLAQFNHSITPRNIVPDDPQFNSQWQWVNTGSNGIADADVDADQAWEITTGGTTATGKDIVVAVVESGINVSHPDLVANIWHNPGEIPNNGIDDDNNGYLDDYDGWNIGQDNDNIPAGNHGTAVSGMIGAVGNNGLGVTGINWDVKIMAISMQGVYESNVVEAYTYPYVQRKRFNETGGDEGAFVVAINSSWGIDNGQPANSPIWCAFYDTLGVQGILSCGATANNAVDVDVVGDLPTACPSDYLISVTATNSSDQRTFSGYGLETIDLGAPGANIFSTSGQDSYSNTSGTSFASPLTAGVIALMYSIPCETLGAQALTFPAETALQIRDALFAGVDIKSNLIPETKTGGRVNAFKSLELLLQNCGPCPSPSNLSVSELTDTTALLSWNGALDAQDYSIRYRLEGTPEWDTIYNATNPYLLTNLSGCASYEYQVYTACSDTTAEFSESFLFGTEGCCIPPDEIEVTNISADNATIQWNSVYAATGYSLIIKPWDPNQSEVTVVPTENPFTLSGLGPCQGYDFFLVSNCDSGEASDPSESVSFSTDCPCAPPAFADTTQVNLESATYAWDSAENASNYVVRFKELSAIDWNLAAVSGNSYLIDSLVACKNYRVQVKTVCPTAESSYTAATIFKTDCVPSSTGTIQIQTPNLEVFPNPFTEEVSVLVELIDPQEVTIQWFDPLGRLVWNKDLGMVQEGRAYFELSVGSLPSGIYWVRVQIDDVFIVRKVLKQ